MRRKLPPLEERDAHDAPAESAGVTHEQAQDAFATLCETATCGVAPAATLQLYLTEVKRRDRQHAAYRAKVAALLRGAERTRYGSWDASRTSEGIAWWHDDDECVLVPIPLLDALVEHAKEGEEKP